MSLNVAFVNFRRGLVFFGEEVRAFLLALASVLRFMLVIMTGLLTFYGTLVLIVLPGSPKMHYAFRGDWVLPGAALYFFINMLVVFVRHVIRLGETGGRSGSVRRRPLDYF